MASSQRFHIHSSGLGSEPASDLCALPGRVDLAVSKIARFADNEKENIAALVRLGLTSADEIEQRATSALGGFVGGQAMLLLNLRDAVALAHQTE